MNSVGRSTQDQEAMGKKPAPLDIHLSYYRGLAPEEFFTWQFRKYRFGRIIPYFGQTVLDVGCGLGAETEYLRDHFGRRIAAVEANGQALAVLKEKGIEACLTLDAMEKDFDTVYASHVIEHISPGRVYEFVRKLVAHVRPGGTLVIISPVGKWFWDTPDHYRMYDRPAILALFRVHGLQEVFHTYTGSQNVACNVLRPVRRYLFSHEWSLALFYRLSKLSKRDLVIVGRKEMNRVESETAE